MELDNKENDKISENTELNKEISLDEAKKKLDIIKNGHFKQQILNVLGNETLKQDEQTSDDRDIEDMFKELFDDAEDQPNN